MLLVPIGMGVILANVPLGGLTEAGGLLAVLRAAGIDTQLFPLLIFIGVGAMIDFGSLLERPYTVFLGAAAQFRIFGTFFLAYFLGDGGLRLFDFSFNDAVSIGIIGSADGPTSIYVATMLGSKYAPAIVVAAYSYMALVPIIQPPIMRALTTEAERRLAMPTRAQKVSRRTRVLFPILTILVVGLIAPKANPLIGAAGISAFPMCARVVQRVGLEANPHNHLLMHAAGANTAGQIASVVAGGAALVLAPVLRLV